MKLPARGTIVFMRSTIVSLFPACILWLLTYSAVWAQSSPDAQMAKSQKLIDQVVAALSARSDADSLAAAGLMSIGKHSGESSSLIARATAAAPDRPDLVWLQAERCSELPPCDSERYERRLRELDPANGAGSWGALARAGASHDSGGIDTALAAISHSERVDIYWTTLIAHLSPAVAKTKKMSLEESEIAILGYMAAQALPPYKYISDSCKGERLQQTGVTEVCRGVAKALQNGDTYVTEMIGVAIAKRVWPESSPEWQAAAAERRVYDYRAKLYPRLESRMATHAKDYLTLCAQNRREQDVLRAQLVAVGENPDPPL